MIVFVFSLLFCYGLCGCGYVFCWWVWWCDWVMWIVKCCVWGWICGLDGCCSCWVLCVFVCVLWLVVWIGLLGWGCFVVLCVLWCVYVWCWGWLFSWVWLCWCWLLWFFWVIVCCFLWMWLLVCVCCCVCVWVVILCGGYSWVRSVDMCCWLVYCFMYWRLLWFVCLFWFVCLGMWLLFVCLCWGFGVLDLGVNMLLILLCGNCLSCCFWLCSMWVFMGCLKSWLVVCVDGFECWWVCGGFCVWCLLCS